MTLPQFSLIAFTTLGSGLLGGAIGGLGGFLKWNREKRMALNQLLYELLDIRFQLSRSNPEIFFEVMRTAIAKQFGTEAAKTLNNPEIQIIFKETLKGLQESFDRPTLSQGYESSVDAVAPFDPILAYGLKGKGDLWKYESAIQGYYERVLSHPDNISDVLLHKNAPVMESVTLRLIYDKMLNGLSEDCIKVARRLSWLPRFSKLTNETRETLERQSAENNEDVEATLSGFFKILKNHPSIEGM